MVVQRGRRRVADLGHDRTDMEQQAGLPIAQQRHIGAAVTCLRYDDGEPMAFALEARPQLVQLGGGSVRAGGSPPDLPR
jgi:hypothetical protein